MRTERGDWGLSRLARRASKSERQRLLQQLVREDPLLTDQMLARKLNVSVQTIRLDRLELGVPEMRARARQVVERVQGRVKSLGPAEVAGDLIDLELGVGGISILETTQEMAFAKTGIVRGHHLFAQGNSLAVAVIDAEVALTGSARLVFHRPVRVGDRVVAKATVKRVIGNKSIVRVESRVDGEKVFSATLTIFALDQQDLEAQKGGRQ